METQSSPQKTLNTHKAPSGIPSRLLSNIFLLVGIGVLVFSGRIVEGTLGQYLIGSLAEILLAILAVGCVKLNKLPIKQTMRLNWPGWEPIFLCIIAAPGLWMMGVANNIITSLILGYTVPTPPQMFPTNLWEAIGFAVTAVLVAPICEELMFRGYVQRAYDRGKPLIGILAGGLIFAMYHMQFQSLFALIPVALALGFVAWRTDSVLPGMFLHAAYNMIATIILIATTFLPIQVVTALLVILILLGIAGIAITVIAFWALWRKTEPKAKSQPEKVSGLLQWVWVIPLLLLALIYTYGSISEVIAGRFPELLAVESLDFHPQPAWQEQQTWAYDIQDLMGTSLGSAECTLKPFENTYELSCHANHQSSSLMDNIPWDIPWLSERFNIPESEWEQDVIWDAESLNIVALRGYQSVSNRKTVLDLERNRHILNIEYADDAVNALDVSADALILGEWPWRLAGLPLDMLYGSSVPLITLDGQGGIDTFHAFVSVRSAEPTWTDTGSLITWKVTVSYTDNAGEEITETAWYDTTLPHPLVRYDDGQVSYVIRSPDKPGYIK